MNIFYIYIYNLYLYIRENKSVIQTEKIKVIYLGYLVYFCTYLPTCPTTEDYQINVNSPRATCADR